MKTLLIVLIPIHLLGKQVDFLSQWLNKYPSDLFLYGYAVGIEEEKVSNDAIKNLYRVVFGVNISTVGQRNESIIDGYSAEFSTEKTLIQLKETFPISGIQVLMEKKRNSFFAFAYVSKSLLSEQINQEISNLFITGETILSKWTNRMTITCDDIDSLNVIISKLSVRQNISNPELIRNLSFNSNLFDALNSFKENIGQSTIKNIKIKIWNDNSLPEKVYSQFVTHLSELPGIEISSNEFSKIIKCSGDSTLNNLKIEIEDAKGGNLAFRIDVNQFEQYLWPIQSILFYPGKLNNNLFGILTKYDNNFIQKKYSIESVPPKYKNHCLKDLPYNIEQALNNFKIGGLKVLYSDPNKRNLWSKDRISLERTKKKYSSTLSYDFGEIVLDYSLLNKDFGTKGKIDKFRIDLESINFRMKELISRIQNEGLSKDEYATWHSIENFNKYVSILKEKINDQLTIINDLRTAYKEIFQNNNVEIALIHYSTMLIENSAFNYIVFKNDLDSLRKIFQNYYDELLTKANYFFETGNLDKALVYLSACLFLRPSKNFIYDRINAILSVNLTKEISKIPRSNEQLISVDSLILLRFYQINLAIGSIAVKRNIQIENEKNYYLDFEFSLPPHLYNEPGIVISDDIIHFTENTFKEILDFNIFCKYALNYNTELNITIIGAADVTGFSKHPKNLVKSTDTIFVLELDTLISYNKLRKTKDDFLLNAALAYSRGKEIEENIKQNFKTFNELLNITTNAKFCSVSDLTGPQYRCPTIICKFKLTPKLKDDKTQFNKQSYSL
jgi:hypothetical protein